MSLYSTNIFGTFRSGLRTFLSVKQFTDSDLNCCQCHQIYDHVALKKIDLLLLATSSYYYYYYYYYYFLRPSVTSTVGTKTLRKRAFTNTLVCNGLTGCECALEWDFILPPMEWHGQLLKQVERLPSITVDDICSFADVLYQFQCSTAWWCLVPYQTQCVLQCETAIHYILYQWLLAMVGNLLSDLRSSWEREMVNTCCRASLAVRCLFKTN